MSPDDRNPARRPAPDLAPPREIGAAAQGAADDAPGGGAEPPLVVDLDGSLTPVDTLHESAIGLLACGLFDFVAVARAARGGKAAVKAAIADRVQLDVACLPWREEALELIREARAAGREVHLVTAADQGHSDSPQSH